MFWFRVASAKVANWLRWARAAYQTRKIWKESQKRTKRVMTWRTDEKRIGAMLNQSGHLQMHATDPTRKAYYAGRVSALHDVLYKKS